MTEPFVNAGYRKERGMIKMDEAVGLRDNEYRMMQAIYERTKGDTEGSVDMWEMGRSLGFDRKLTEDTVTCLMVEGLLELRSLGGSISITVEGREMIERSSGASEERSSPWEQLNRSISEIRRMLPEIELPRELLHDLEIDLKTLELQLRKTRPSSPIIQEALKAIRGLLEGALPGSELAKLIDGLCK